MVTGNGSLTLICSLLKRSLSSSLTLLAHAETYLDIFCNSGVEMFYDSCKDVEADTIVDEKVFWIHFLTKMIQTVKTLTQKLIALKIRLHLQDLEAEEEARKKEKRKAKKSHIQTNRMEVYLLSI